MIATLIASQIARKKRQVRSQEQEQQKSDSEKTVSKSKSAKSKSRTANNSTTTAAHASTSKPTMRATVDGISLIRRYVDLLKSTFFAFVFSTCLHVGTVSLYYFAFLRLNPDDPGKKAFYSATSVSPGINIGGKLVGGGGIQTNHHKSYLVHLIREHYRSLSRLFFVQFSGLYLLILYLLKFFQQREQLKADTYAAFEPVLEHHRPTAAADSVTTATTTADNNEERHSSDSSSNSSSSASVVEARDAAAPIAKITGVRKRVVVTRRESQVAAAQEPLSPQADEDFEQNTSSEEDEKKRDRDEANVAEMTVPASSLSNENKKFS